MNPYHRIILTILCSVGISLLLMWIVQSEHIYNKKDLAAADSPQGKQLTEQNIVDYMMSLPLQLRVANVGWHQSILSVDLLSTPGNTIDTMVYHDLFELSQFGLQEVSNVNQVRVRIIEHKGTERSHPEILLAMDSRKENMQNQKTNLKELNTLNRQKYLQSHYRFTYTQKWKEQFVD
jgi:hypothetical protein